MDGIGGTAIIFAFGTWLVGQAAVLFAGVDALDCSAFPQGPLESSCKNNKLGAGFAGFFLLIGFFVCTAGSILHLKPPPASHAGVGGFAAGFGFLLLSKATLGFALANEPGACKSGDVASLDSNSKICAASVSSGLFDLFGFVVVLGGVALSLAKKDTSGIVAGCAFGLGMLLLADVEGGTLSGAIGLFQLYDSDQCDSENGKTKLCKGALAAGLFWVLGALVCLACSVAHIVRGHQEGSSSAANPPTGKSTAMQEAELSSPTSLTAATPGLATPSNLSEKQAAHRKASVSTHAQPLQQAYAQYGSVFIPQRGIEAVFNQIDTDHNGVLDENEMRGRGLHVLLHDHTGVCDNKYRRECRMCK